MKRKNHTISCSQNNRELRHYKKSKFNNIGLAIVLFAVSISYSISTQAQDYPFTLPDTVVATLDVQTSNQEVFRNALLGYNISGFSSTQDKSLINTFDPTTMRFPHGLWSNWYDWRTDQSRVFGTDTFMYIHQGSGLRESVITEINALKTFERLKLKVGIDGLEQLNTTKKAANQGVGYDVVWTFNMSADGTDFTNGSPESVARYNDLIARGLDVKVIEMGNECFYPGQRSSIIPNATEYMARAKSMSAAIKAIDPTVQFSIPLLRRGSWPNPTWNADLTKDSSYFDAITVHTYIGHDPDDHTNSDNAYSTALTARNSLEASTNDYVRPYTKKPIWLTEWGVKSGGPNAASVLGMADCYLFMAENQDVYHRANWYSVNGVLNSFLVWDGKSIKYPLEKTSYGSTHEILKPIFENSTMYESTVTTSELVAGVKAVNARAVTKDGVTTVFAINLTDKPAVFNLNIDGVASDKTFLHEAMAYDNVGQERVMGINENPLSVVKDGHGEIILPPLSLNKITLKSPVQYAVKFESPANGAKIDIGTDLIVEASAGSEVISVSLFINETLVRNITSAPYQWGVDTSVDVSLKNMDVGYYDLKIVAENADAISISESITIEIKDTISQLPYKGRIAIPGKFESENYDEGGEGEAYHDSDDNNQSGYYRSDAVDIGTGGTGYIIGYTNTGEWIEYTLDVAEGGLYDIAAFYASNRPGGGGKIGVSLPDEDVSLINSFELPVTGAWSTYEELNIGTVYLAKGVQVLRLSIEERGFNLDWVDFKKATTPLGDFALSTRLIGGGTITKSPDSIFYASGTEVTLTATTKPGSIFTGWNGDVNSEDATITVTLDSSIYLVANFVPITYQLQVSAENGTVIQDPQLDIYVVGTQVSLTANAKMGYQFTGWSGETTSAENPLTIAMDSNINLVANFVSAPYQLNITAENGTITQDLQYDSYVGGTQVELTATPKEGYRFTGWSGDLSSVEPVVTVTMDSSINLVASFFAITYQLQVSAENGTVIQNPQLDSYASGAQVILTANPEIGYQFTGWSGDVSSVESIITVTMDSTISITANFETASSLRSSYDLQLRIYPNPSKGIFNVDVAKSTSYAVYNLSGVKLIEGKANGAFELDMTPYSTGVYLLKIKAGEAIVFKRILIQ